MYRTLGEILAHLRAGLEALYGPRLVLLLLYGLQARGEATAESDIDVLVVLQGSVEPGAEIARVGYLTLRPYRCSITWSFHAPLSRRSASAVSVALSSSTSTERASRYDA